MTRSLLHCWWVAVAVAGSAASAGAQIVGQPIAGEAAPTPARGSLEPAPTPAEPAPIAARGELAAELRMRLGIERSGVGAPEAFVEAGGPRVLVRLRGALSEADAAALARLGFVVDRLPDGRLVPGALQSGWVDWQGLEALAAHPLVERVEPGRAVGSLRPLDTIGAMQGTLRAHLRPDDGLTGDGVVVAALDSAIDVLHPHFFHADAGIYGWVDVDGDGGFGAGDGVALDEMVAPLVVMDGGFYDPVTDASNWQNLDDRLDVSLDWLFADLNGDGLRNAGARAGFGDDDPALGEPLFVAHDANGDGRLGVEERLFRLGTSKVRQVSVGGQSWRRGVDLAVAADVGRGVDSSHATGVASILLGGQPGFHRRIGLAPGAEYVGYASFDGDRAPALFADARAQGAVVMLHEWSQPVGVPGDGSSIFESVMDGARADGMVQVCPLGNLNGAGKHVERGVVHGSVALPFVVGDGFFDGREVRPYEQVMLHVAWVGDEVPSGLQWVMPGGAVADLVVDGEPHGLGGDVWYAAALDRSSRGTGWVVVYLWRDGGAGITAGEWGVVVNGLADGRVVTGRLSDAWSGWSPGVVWVDPTVGRGTLTYPSTADSAVGVAAYGGRADVDVLGGGLVGELRGYSGRGPRIDGRGLVAIAAPDDPLAALSSSALPDFPRGHSSLFTPFGGTSGAGPHVAAAVALLAEQHGDWGAAALEGALMGGAEGDGLVPDLGGVPNDGWGFGQLRVHRSLYGMDVSAGNGGAVIAGVEFDGMGVAVGAVDAEGDGVRFRVDWDYDGVWDGGWQEDGWFGVEGRYGMGEAFVVRVGARDVLGGGMEWVGGFVMAEVDVGVVQGGVDGGGEDGGGEDGGVVDAGGVEPDSVVVVGGDGRSGGGMVGCDVRGGGSGGGLVWVGGVLVGLLLRWRR